MSNKQIIIFDLDHTLFKTNQFMADLFNILSQNNEVDEILSVFSLFKKEHLYNFDLENFLNYLKQNNIKLLPSVIQQARLFVKADLNNYLITDAKIVLSQLQKQGFKLILLSRGHKNFQLIKIRGAGLDVFFKDNIRVGNDSNFKFRILQEYCCDNQKIIFVNDNWQENVSLMSSFPQVKFILYIRSDASKFYNEQEVKTDKIKLLSELYLYLK